MLIDTTTVSLHLADPDWLILDCRHDLFDHQRGARVYAEGHVPGAHFVPVETILSGKKTGRNGRHPLPLPADFVGFLNELGATPRTQIIAYDDAGGQYAARVWWMARWLGLPEVAVLDGGLPKWVAGGLPLITEKPAPRGGGTLVPKPDNAKFIPLAELQTEMRDGRCLVVDARAAERFRGEKEPIDPVAGRIPGAANRFFKDNFNPDQTIRPVADLRREFETLLAGRPPEEIVHQCGSGVTACVNLLAMEFAGLKGSRLYVGSWSEWISDPTRPIARG